jgi:hypothetical protein
MAIKLTYNHEEIGRYLQKQMSPAEMHAFEKAMMSDPFLADALEGYWESDATLANQHLSEIREAINPKKEEGRVVDFNSSAKWLRIAAIFLVLVGAALITYKILNKPGEGTELAKTNEQPILPADTISATDESLAQQGVPGTPRKPGNENPVITPPSLTEREVFTTESAAPLAMKKSSNDSTSMALLDTSVQADATSVGNVAEAKAPKDLAARSMATQSAPAQPRDGWVKFQAYVDKEVSLAKEKNSAYSGSKVELEFSVDNVGNVADIKVLSATNTEVAKTAVEILKKSPRWTPLANNARAKIVISF